MFQEFIEKNTDPDLIVRVPVAWAKEEGYRFLLDCDGGGQILTPCGDLFAIANFQCSCNEHVYRTYCLHELWMMQLRPCQACGSLMEFSDYTTCFGQRMNWFECSSCGNVRDLDLVREERKLGVVDPRLTPYGRCQQAIAWLSANGSEWYVWQTIYQSPELIPVMVEALSEIDHHLLADRIIQKAGFRAA